MELHDTEDNESASMQEAVDNEETETQQADALKTRVDYPQDDNISCVCESIQSKNITVNSDESSSSHPSCSGHEGVENKQVEGQFVEADTVV